MLTEQIIEFELRGPEPPGRTCGPIAGYFHDKTKIFYGKSFSALLFTDKNIARGNVSYFFLPGPNHLQNLIPKCKILIVFWT